MTASKTALFPQLPFHGSAVATGVNATLSGALDANVVEVVWNDPDVVNAAIEADGAQIVGLWALPCAQISATAMHVYLSTDGGTTKRIWATATAPANTVSASSAPAEVVFKVRGAAVSEANPLYLPPGAGSKKARLYFGIGVALAAGCVLSVQGLRMTKAPAEA